MEGETVSLDHLEELLDDSPPFNVLSGAERRQLFDEALLAFYEPGTEILAQGVVPAHPRYLYLVVSGAVQLTDTESGRLIDRCDEGAVFGHYALLREGPLPYEARAIEPTQCVLIPEAAFFRVYRSNRAFAAFFDNDLAAFSARLRREQADAVGAPLLLNTPLRTLVRRPPIGCAPETPVQEAARIMRAERIGSILVMDAERRPVGILTNSDLRDKVVAEGRLPDMPVEALMSAPPVTIAADAPILEGLVLMARHGFHHLVLTEDGTAASPVVGVISGQDIAHARGHDPVATIKRIEQADSLAVLASLREETFVLLRQLRHQGAPAVDLLRISTELSDRVAVRVLELVEAQLREERPDQTPELPWVWMALGSEGRREMSFKADQDNALIYADPHDETRARRAEEWFGELARRANDALEQVGFPRCPADMMASNPRWRQALSGWKRTFRRWIFEPDEKALLHASIFFDLRALYGAGELVEQLKDDLQQALQEERGFLPFMMRNALRNRPPLSFFRRFVLDRSGEQRPGFDIKLRGLMPIVDLARILALEAGYLRTTGTLDRLQAAAERIPEVRQTCQNLQEAYRLLTEVRLDHQLRQIEAGQPPDNHIVPEQLSGVQRKMLKIVFSMIQEAQEALAMRYGAHMIRM
ncbi:putative CBS domain and cyclic nucleotide-regulated nucleotidyltransferase [Rhodothermus marinus SG0.5JP17-172]|jgi:CBS domain-containing protein|uniref:putative nucleotidyltransferase substrate binding domain-containing protein n=1 Tax=Rhodothermus marinus TaxID=29549 RepID=UPI000223DD1A|nr:putative nucleotidyltransferase substrate binding domain-containing protein [Rhodothermus marinus]AEN72694.1 putative CBS domain and cyclic nucleotide-regulated nucleotidyltransferase [Rhodothermus marinus SG0.5JP17-172]MBO2490635.1 cyclic nucleotide-binding/CBS domain-containing protein [Rhodothermus marinus]